MGPSYTIGVDIGGTKVAAGLVDAAGNIVYKTRVPMSATGSAEAGLRAVLEAIEAVISGVGTSVPELARSRRLHAVAPAADSATGRISTETAEIAHAIRGIGVCSPGPLDPNSGVVLNPPNLPCWRNFPLCAEVSREFGVPTKVENDANAAALAEAIWGAGVGHRNVFYATLGTGIGSGLILERKIYNGRTGSAPEGGHMTIDYRGPQCGCGKRGCIEILASGPAIAQRARDSLAKHSGETLLTSLCQGDASSLTSEMVGRAYLAGDALATRVLSDTAELLTVWLGNIADLLEPDVIIMGGGVSTMMQPFFAAMRERLPEHAIIKRAGEIPLVLARYGEDAGVAGAAALV